VSRAPAPALNGGSARRGLGGVTHTHSDDLDKIAQAAACVCVSPRYDVSAHRGAGAGACETKPRAGGRTGMMG
jgi:hypothetical protein